MPSFLAFLTPPVSLSPILTFLLSPFLRLSVLFLLFPAGKLPHSNFSLMSQLPILDGLLIFILLFSNPSVFNSPLSFTFSFPFQLSPHFSLSFPLCKSFLSVCFSSSLSSKRSLFLFWPLDKTRCTSKQKSIWKSFSPLEVFI